MKLWRGDERVLEERRRGEGEVSGSLRLLNLTIGGGGEGKETRGRVSYCSRGRRSIRWWWCCIRRVEE